MGRIAERKLNSKQVVQSSERAIASKVTVYPNPTSSEFTLVMTRTSNLKATIIVTDIAGRKVYETTAAGSLRFGAEFKAGIYIINVVRNGKAEYKGGKGVDNGYRGYGFQIPGTGRIDLYPVFLLPIRESMHIICKHILCVEMLQRRALFC